MALITYPQIWAQVTSVVSAQPILVQLQASLSNSPVQSIPQVQSPIPYMVT